MGEVRFYAIGITEMRGIVGAPDETAEHLREIARQAFRREPEHARAGLLGKLGPIFRRVPAAPVVLATDPEPRDVEVLLAGGYVPPDRTGATWRVLETLVAGIAWGSTRMALTDQGLDDLDFALARGGVSSFVGLRHLLGTTTSMPLVPVHGLDVGWHHYEQALAMAGAYRSALGQVEDEGQRAMVAALATWLDGFVPWAAVSGSLGRPVPDLVAFWAH